MVMSKPVKVARSQGRNLGHTKVAKIANLLCSFFPFLRLQGCSKFGVRKADCNIAKQKIGGM